jgi:hypothetical protein
MDAPDVDLPPAPIPPRDFVLRSSPNWTAVIFFAGLSVLHFSIAIPAFIHARWEGYVSAFFASAFVGVTWLSCRFKFELAILPRAKMIRLRRGLRRLYFQRFIPFCDVQGVRLTTSHPSRRRRARGESRIELLCDNEDIECPPTNIPRQQALFLAILLGARLIKVSDHEAPEPSEPSEVEPVGRF